MTYYCNSEQIIAVCGCRVSVVRYADPNNPAYVLQVVRTAQDQNSTSAGSKVPAGVPGYLERFKRRVCLLHSVVLSTDWTRPLTVERARRGFYDWYHYLQNQTATTVSSLRSFTEWSIVRTASFLIIFLGERFRFEGGEDSSLPPP